MKSMDAIQLSGVRTHNLKNLNLTLPHNRFYVITGVSGSGKSSLAFDTLYAEGQRRYVESLSAYARQFLERMEKPDVDQVAGIRPAVAIEAKNAITNARSTVGTQTEVNDYLRVFFARVGITTCPDCGLEVASSRPESVASQLLEKETGAICEIEFRVAWTAKKKTILREIIRELERQGFSKFRLGEKLVTGEEALDSKEKIQTLGVLADRVTVDLAQKKRLLESLELAFRYGKGEIQIQISKGSAGNPLAPKKLTFSEAFSCSGCGKVFRRPTPNLFSFNSPLGACPLCQGFGRVITVDWDLVVPDPSKTLAGGAIEPWSKPGAVWEFKQLLAFTRKRKIATNIPWKKLPQATRNLILFGGPGISEEEFFSVQDFFKYLEKKTYKMHVRIFLAKYRNYIPCKECGETRLKREALFVRVQGRTLHELQMMSLRDLHVFMKSIQISSEAMNRVEPVYQEILRRVEFLVEVGLGYLSLARLSRTLSGGEVERIHLATSLGSALVDALYVVDEPSIGLHERDNELLIRLLRKLRDLGNTVVVVEHDKKMIEAADEILDLGPAGGQKGGKILYQGSVEGLRASKNSVTGKYLSGEFKIERKGTGLQNRSLGLSPCLKIFGASEHNLKSVDLEIPLGKWVVMTGVSGSGKSTLLYDILYHHYERFRGRPVQSLGQVKWVEGYEQVTEMVLLDQSPIGRTPRSNPATYMKAYDEVRSIFARLPESKRRGFGSGHFSFNVEGGRCPACEGGGRIKVEMHFLADVFVTCEACHGKRFKPEVLEVAYHGKNIDAVLNLTVDEALEHFSDESRLVQKLNLLKEVGLGYLKLGQAATTLSGGEAQRLKIAAELNAKPEGHVLYLLDEPTTGLHAHDIRDLVRALERLLDLGHSLLIIEHNMEIIRLADHVIDLGPEGGNEGGQVVYSGSLEGLQKNPNSHTGRYLKAYEQGSAKDII